MLAVVVVVAVGLVASACTSSQQALPVPPSAPAIHVSLEDRNLVFDTPVPAGRVVFHVRNAGTHPHRFALVPLPDDAPPLEQDLHDDVERPVRRVARIPTLQPGETGMFAVDLIPGQRYGMLDYSTTPDGVQHMMVGVAGEFRAQPAPSPTPSPTPDRR